MYMEAIVAAQTDQKNTTLGGLSKLPAGMADHFAPLFGSISGKGTGYPIQYAASLVLAVRDNGGKPVTKDQVAKKFLALGGTAPGHSNPNGYHSKKNLSPLHSAKYGANRHLGSTLGKWVKEDKNPDGKGKVYSPLGTLRTILAELTKTDTTPVPVKPTAPTKK